jgi:hypothetical protein
MSLSFSYACDSTTHPLEQPQFSHSIWCKTGAINPGVIAHLLLGQMVGVAVALAEKLAVAR